LAAAVVTPPAIGAFAALLVSMAALAFLAAGRRAFAVVGMLVVIGALVVAAYQPFQSRIKRWVVASTSGRIDDLLSNRATGILAAWEMTKDRPLLGVGPGCYGFELD